MHSLYVTVSKYNCPIQRCCNVIVLGQMVTSDGIQKLITSCVTSSHLFSLPKTNNLAVFYGAHGPLEKESTMYSRSICCTCTCNIPSDSCQLQALTDHDNLTMRCDPRGHGKEPNAPNCPHSGYGRLREVVFGALLRKCRKVCCAGSTEVCTCAKYNLH